MKSETDHSIEISKGERFSFGENWNAFLQTLDEQRLMEAEQSLAKMLDMADLNGKRFLDIGSGSGLFSLCARRLGAEVFSFDYDPNSVACTQKLKDLNFPDDTKWTVDQGSVLDRDYVSQLGEFDVVYSWGVLHHTGDMQSALDNAVVPVATDGLLFIAIYNDQNVISEFWKKVKKAYCSGEVARMLINGVFFPIFGVQGLMLGLARFNNPFAYFTNYKKRRGMSITHDWIDWLGGYPFEVASPEQIFLCMREYGFVLQNLTTTNGQGCNQFVFRKVQGVQN